MKKEKQTAEQNMEACLNSEIEVDENNEAENNVNVAEDAENAAEEQAENEEEPNPEEAMSRLAAAYAELENANKSLELAKQNLNNQLARLQADFDNFRRRTRAEKEDWQKNFNAVFCGELLPVIDNFGRAMQALKTSEADAGHLAGVEMIARQLAELLASKGVERIPALGEDFDPNWHEAVGQTVVEDDAMVGKVTQEIQPGYRIGDKILRASMVHVGAK